jgi:hypothetical protein
MEPLNGELRCLLQSNKKFKQGTDNQNYRHYEIGSKVIREKKMFGHELIHNSTSNC